jgi:hypothetical protein
MITDKVLRSGCVINGAHDHRPVTVLECHPRSYLVTFRSRSVHQKHRGVEVFNFKDKSVNVCGHVLSTFAMSEEGLTETIKGAKHVTFTGHGFGGALAIFASAYYSHVFENMHVDCHTFGAHPVGDVRFVEWYRTGVGDSANIVMPFHTATWPTPFMLASCADHVLIDVNPFQKYDMDTYLRAMTREKKPFIKSTNV